MNLYVISFDLLTSIVTRKGILACDSSMLAAVASVIMLSGSRSISLHQLYSLVSYRQMFLAAVRTVAQIIML